MRKKNPVGKSNNKILGLAVIFIFIFIVSGYSYSLLADQLVHKFGSPAFNGQNQSAHYLTIDEQERTRQEKIAEDIQDALEEASRQYSSG